MSRRNTAVLLIDMQPRFVGDIELAERDRLVVEHKRLLAASLKLERPVFVLEYEGFGVTTIHLVPAACRHEYRIIQKKENSGFSNTSLHQQLEEMGVKNVILAGINASLCVYDTALQGFGLGYQMLTSSKLIADNPDLIGHGKRLREYSNGGMLYEHEDLFGHTVEHGRARQIAVALPSKRVSRWKQLKEAR